MGFIIYFDLVSDISMISKFHFKRIKTYSVVAFLVIRIVILFHTYVSCFDYEIVLRNHTEMTFTKVIMYISLMMKYQNISDFH